jgi:hypothetical protein
MASKRAQRRKSCGRKVRYGTEAAALAGLRALTRAKGFQGRMLTYRCGFCGGYHFGHPPAHIKKALGARA